MPELHLEGDAWIRVHSKRTVGGVAYAIYLYRPQIEGLFARIERLVNRKTGGSLWRARSSANITTLYGQTPESRIADPAKHRRVFTWLIYARYDDRCNVMAYEYKAENQDNVNLTQTHKHNRTEAGCSTNRYLKRVRYGNRVSRLVQPDLSQADWTFESIFDYGEPDSKNPTPDKQGDWLSRPDPFFTYRSGFEVRTYHLCRRILMFHYAQG